MLNNIKLENILFLDIETVSGVKTYDELDERLMPLWDKKAGQITKDEKSPEEVYERAGIYAEFGKIVCISVGFITGEQGNRSYRSKSFASHDEKELLNEFCALLNAHYNKPDQLLCAHNGKEFDFPYIARRLLINGIRLPKMLDIAGKKPWEVQHLDTMELWKFGDFKNYTSLNLLAAVFDIPTPKDDIDGSDVGRVYWQENDLDRIVTYCQKDVLTIAQLLLRMKGEELIGEESVKEI